MGYSPWGPKESGTAEQLSTHMCMCVLSHTHTHTHTHTAVLSTMPSTERFYLGLPEGLMGGKQSSLLGTDTPHGREQALRESPSGVSTR